MNLKVAEQVWVFVTVTCSHTDPFKIGIAPFHNLWSCFPYDAMYYFQFSFPTSRESVKKEELPPKKY